MTFLALSLFILLGLFQIALAWGLPWGVAAFGGQHPGTLPTKFRIASAISILPYGLSAFALWSAETSAWLLWLLFSIFALGTAMNAVSRSRVERLIWTPVVAVISVAFLLRALA